MKKHCFLLILLSLFTTSVISQGVAINNTGAKADESAMLDISSTEAGLLIPRVTLLQRNAIDSPATGLLVYQTNGITGFYVYSGSNWELIWAGERSIDALSDGRVIGSSVYLGSSAGVLDDGTNNYNVGVGTQVLNQNIEGFFNVATGYQALYNNTQSRNTAIGYQSLYHNQTGQSNTGLGFRSGFSNNSGSHNTLIGYGANLYNETGSNNTIIGSYAGWGTSGLNKSGNVFLGYQAGYNETGSNRLFIENSNSDSPLIYGEFDNDILRVNGTLHIGNAYHFPLSDGTSGQVLSTDGSGALAWSTPGTGGGITQLNDLSDAKTGGNSVFLGSDAGAADDASDNRNSALGIASLYSNTTGLYNSALGYRASYHNTTGNYNIIHGPFADYRNQGGSQNIMIGYHAGSGTSNHSKSGNIRIGYQAGYGDTTDNKLYIENSSSSSPLIWGDFDADSVRINGDLVVTGKLSGDFGIDDLNDGRTISSSIFLGENAGGSDDGSNNKNTALGYNALPDVTGEQNIAIGYKSSNEMTTGNYNIAIGSSANSHNTGGEKNVILGNFAGVRFSEHNNSGNVFIGYAAGYNQLTDNKLFIENTTSSTPLIWGDFEKDSVMINGDFGVTGEWTGLGIDDLSDGKKIGDCLYLGTGSGGNSYSGTFDYNVAVGDSTLYSHDPTACVAVGYKALFSNEGDNNTAVGFMALADNTNKESNTAVGYKALRYSTGGSYNTAIGSETLLDNTTGDYNTAIGHRSLYNNTEGYSNTATGYLSMYNNTTGFKNTATGRYSLHSNTTGSHNSAFGHLALSDNQGYSNSAFGCESLMRNDTGIHNTTIGYYSLRENTFGNYNTSTGSRALYLNKTGSGNTANGYSALKNNTEGSNNVALGHWALSANSTGYRNTSCGAFSTHSNTTGYENTALGYTALKGNTTGHNNVAVGDSTLPVNTTGWDNVAVGSRALLSNVSGKYNVAIGQGAMWSNTSGNDNVAIGEYSLEDNVDGDHNTAIGDWAMNNNANGDHNTALGYDSGPSFGYVNLSNTTSLGYSANLTESNHIVLGNSSVTWIGGQVSWSTFSDARMKENIVEDVKGLDFIMKLRPVTYHVKKDEIDRILGAKDDSDYPEKYDIEKIKQTGFLAQEVEQAALESGYDFSGVRVPKNEHTPYSLSYTQFVVPLVKAVQEHQEEIEELRQQINRSAAIDEEHPLGRMNVYNGNVVTNDAGYAEVQLPQSFDGTVMDFRYQLTVIGDFAQAIISKEIIRNQFEIRTDKPNVKVSWQVMGVYLDALFE